MPGIISMDDQPISATFFDEGRWLTEFITPEALEVQELYKSLTKNIASQVDRVRALHQWVGNEIQYKPFIKAKMWVEGKSSVNTDVWLRPSITRRVKVGNCANKSFLLTSLLRNEFSPAEVHTVLGNLYNGKPGGHAWVQVQIGDRAYIVESTRGDVEVLVLAATTQRYQAVHFFNDKTAWAIEGRTVMEPFSRCFSTWLKDYLDMSYIRGNKE